MTRLYKDAPTLGVRTRDDIPIAIHWGQAWHPIQHIALRWQMDVNWWRERIYRDYYKVLTQKGLLWSFTFSPQARGCTGRGTRDRLAGQSAMVRLFRASNKS